MMKTFIGPMETFSGLRINPLNMRFDEIRIEDIAHSLSLQCRYGGHCKWFYSVAQHSIQVGQLFRKASMRLFGLLHDAAEAYLGDMIAPLKEKIPEFKTHEGTIQHQIYARFCEQVPTLAERQLIKITDQRMLLTEAAFLMPSRGKNWRKGIQPFHFDIFSLSSEAAEQKFLQMFHSLLGELKK